MSSGNTRSISGSYAYTDTLKSVQYGPGCTASVLLKLIHQLNGTKAFIVTGNSLRTKTDVISNIENILKSESAFGGTFSQIGEHAPIADIQKGIQQIENAGCDIIVAVGGGSPIDASKVIINRLQQQRGGEYMKQIAIPTTLSAAEYTITAGFTNEQGNKTGVAHPQLAPAAIILDGEITLHTPERLWLSSGIRALDHAVENLYRKGVPAPLHALCYAAIRDLFTLLPQCKADPQNVEIRQKLQLASWMSLWPVKWEQPAAGGLSHALGHKLGATYGIGHGITSCLTLSPVVAYKANNASESVRETLSQALFYLNIPSVGNSTGDATRLSQEIDKLVSLLGLKTTLKSCGVPRTDLQQLSEVAKSFVDDAEHQDKVYAMLESIYEEPSSSL